MTDPFHIDETATTSLRGVCKHYDTVRTVDGVDLDVGYGELLSLIGHNGADKSTLFKMMLGLIPTTAGNIHVAGISVRGAAFRTVRRQIDYLPENLILYDNLGGLETLRLFTKLRGASAANCTSLLARARLAGAVDQSVWAYPKGMRQRLRFARALLGTPHMLFLDEPTNGLDPAATRNFYATLQTLREQGATILITSHILVELQQRIDRLAILVDDRVFALGSVAALCAQTDLPLTLALWVETDARGALWAQLAPLHTHGAEIVDGQARHEVVLHCSRSFRMNALRIPQPLGGRLLDLQIHEPSLEDVFFGLRQTEAA